MATSPNGIDIIRKSLASMPDSPGVYRMLDQDGQVLYVGKARQLRKRVVAYTHLEKLPARLQRMVMMTAGMDITVTHTEGEALLLEANLIKEFKPRYNILLRDDKSFPYITITTSHDFPRITKHRGAKKKDDIYFGPFPSVGAVNQSITLLQKAFLLRNCTDSDFSNRPRPCIEYQIKRCSAPCVHKISQQEYQELVQQTKDFLEGKNALVHTTLAKRMEQASNEMEYEKAAIYRDRIQALAAIQAQQAVYIPGMKDADVLAIAHNPGAACIKVLFIRGGQLLGDKSFFPIQIEDYNTADILEAFISKFYQSVPAPASLILSEDIPGRLLLEQALTDLNNRKVTITLPQRGKKLSLVELAITNTREALEYKESVGDG